MNRPTFHDGQCGYGPGSTLFVNGAARGLRSFRLGLDGWLRGVTYEQVWRPGENRARCMVVSATVTSSSPVKDAANKTLQKSYARVVAGWGYPHDPDGEPRLLPGYKATPCPGLDPACACGFYAYHDGSRHGYIGGGYASGVIDGYGRVVLGPNGFRAARARLVAVALPFLDAQAARVYDDLVAARENLQAALGALPRERWWNRQAVSQAREQGKTALANVEAEILEFERAKAAGKHRRSHELLRTRYPGLPVFENDSELLEHYPVEPLSYLLGEGEGEGRDK